MKRLLSRPCRVNAMYQIVCGIQYRANLNLAQRFTDIHDRFANPLTR